MRQFQLVLGGIVAAIIAAIFTIYVFNISTPPRDIEALLRPTPTQTLIAELFPTATPFPTGTPAPNNLIYSVNFTRPGEWPTGLGTQYTKTGYQLTASPNADFLSVPLAGFDDTSVQDIKIVAAGTSADSTSAEYGVYFWHSLDQQGRERFIAFTITSQRTFRLRAYGPYTSSKGEKLMRWTDLVPATTSRNIRVDGRPNQLQVELHPGHIIASINGFAVIDRDNPDIDQYRARSDFDAQVGLIAIPTASGPTRAEFSLFELYDATPDLSTP